MRHSVVLVTVIVVCRTPTASVGAHMPTSSGVPGFLRKSLRLAGLYMTKLSKELSSNRAYLRHADPRVGDFKLRPASALQSFAEAKQDDLPTRCSNAPSRTPAAAAAAPMTDIHKLSPFGGAGFVGRPPCASDQWFIRFRMRQWPTT